MDASPRLYRLRIRGHLGPTLLSAFPTMVSRCPGAETVLTGPLQDRSALYGVLAELEALGLELVELRLIAPGSPGSGDARSPGRA
jgi:hypothetical protein